MNIALCIIIVNWNTKALLANCLKSLLEIDWQSLKTSIDILVVDNASSDGSSVMVKESFPQITLIESDRNLGFGGGVNKAAGMNKAKYYLVSNADMVYSFSVIKTLLSCLESDISVSAVAPKLIGMDGKRQPSAFKFPSITRLFFEQFLSLGNFGEVKLKDDLSHEPEAHLTRTIEADWVLGAAFIIRSDDFHDINGFDEEYFMYSEETDLFFRLKGKGVRILYFLDVTALHIGRGSSSQVSEKMLIQQTKSLVLYFKKNKGRISGLIAFLIILIGQTGRVIVLKVLSLLLFWDKDYRERANIYSDLLKGLILSKKGAGKITN